MSFRKSVERWQESFPNRVQAALRKNKERIKLCFHVLVTFFFNKTGKFQIMLRFLPKTQFPMLPFEGGVVSAHVRTPNSEHVLKCK